MVLTPWLGPLVVGLHVRADEGAVGSLVPARVLGRPTVVEVVGALADARRAVEVEGQQCLVAPAGPRLGEVPELVLRVVVEAPNAGVGAVVVVEGAVLLHEEHDVLDGAEVGAGRLGARRELRHGGAGPLALARRRENGAAAGRQRGGQHGPAVEARALEAHAIAPSRVVPHVGPPAPIPEPFALRVPHTDSMSVGSLFRTLPIRGPTGWCTTVPAGGGRSSARISSTSSLAGSSQTSKVAGSRMTGMRS